MGSGGKGGSGASKTYNVFGTLVGVICRGPVDAVTGIVVDGKSVWEGAKAASGDYTDMKADIVAASGSKWFANSASYFRLYWGTATQSADAGLPAEHPAYRGICYVVAKGFLFGREKYNAPNIEVIIQRKPRVDSSLEGGVNVLRDGQANPILVAAELLTDQVHGLGLPLARLHTASWVSAAQWADDSSRRLRALCSPLLNDSKAVRESIASLLALADCVLARRPDGTIEVQRVEPGVDPGGLSTIDASIMTDQPEFSSGGWGDIPTAIIVKYTDRARLWKASDEKAVNSLALKVRVGETSPKAIDMPHVIRRNQASLWAAEMVRRSSMPSCSLNLQCRRERVAGLRPGSKVLVDVDPEPGGAGLAQLCVVETVRTPPTGPVTLGLVADTLLAALPYSPAFEVPTFDDVTPPPIANALVVALPAVYWDGSFGFGVLAARPSADITGMRVFFARDNAGSFAEMGWQVGFALRLTLDASVDEDDGTFRFTLTDGANGPDAYLAGRTPTGGAVEALNDGLLILVASVDGSGRVTVTDGVPNIEFLSVVSRSAVDSDTFDFSVFRGRLGTSGRAWTTAAVAWLVPLDTLVSWQHPEVTALASSGALGYVRLTSFTPWGADDTTPAPEFAFRVGASLDGAPIITWTTPSGSGGQTDSVGRYTPAFSVADAQGDLTYVALVSETEDGSMIKWAEWQMSPKSSWTYSTGELIIPTVGMHTFTVIARDRFGSESTSSRTIQRPGASGGGALLQPSFSQVPGTVFVSSLNVTITFTSPANRAEWCLKPAGTPSPSSPINTALSSGFTVQLQNSGRLWVRVGDGTNWGGWVYADYTRV